MIKNLVQVAHGGNQIVEKEIFTQQAANLEVFFSPLFFIGTVLMVWIFTAAVLSAIFAAVMPRIWNAHPK